MRLSVNQYAKALYLAVQDKSQNDINLIVENFVKLLQKNGQIKLKKDITEKFADIWNKEDGIVEAQVISSRKLEEKQIQQIEIFVKKKYAAEKVVLLSGVDEKIKGGIIIQVGDELLDASVAKKLDDLRLNLVK